MCSILENQNGEEIRKKFDGNKNIMTTFEQTLKYIDNSGNINLYDINYLLKLSSNII